MQPREFDDPAFLERLRSGDQAAYRALIQRFHRSLIHLAYSVIGSAAQAEEVVQDAWLAVFTGISRFEGRSSLATWLFAIVLNRARSRAQRESRLVSLPTEADRTNERAVPLSAFKPDGHWVDAPRLWEEIDPERVVGDRQLWQLVQTEIDRLPQGQRAVIVLRDIEGQTAEEACMLLNISPENQRVLLHRARSRIRQMVDNVIAMTPATEAAPSPPVRATRPRSRPGVRERSIRFVRQNLAWLAQPLSGLS
jgi:RNA polymerase sigma-70 factor, ECF subfamily